MIGAILTAVKVLSAVVAVKSTLEALKEGNIAGALVSGVGAYFAFSGLGAATTTQAAAAKGAAGIVDPKAAITGTIGEGAATTAGTAAGAGTELTTAVSEGLGAATPDTAMGGMLGEQAAAAEGGAFAEAAFARPPAESAPGFLGAQEGEFLGGLGEPDQVTTSMLEGGTSTAYEDQLQRSAGEGGLLSQIGGYAKENPELLKLGGSMLSGYAKQKQAEKLRREQLRIQEEARRRRGRSASAHAGALTF